MMSESQLKAEELLKGMSHKEQELAMKTLFAIKMAKDKGELRSLLKSASEQVQEFIALMMLSDLENDVMELKKERLKYDASLIRKDAIAILPALIAANPGVSDVALVERSLAMAQRLHDFC
jgi:hypothetical protein